MCTSKPPEATFYSGMTEEEFNEQNKNKISNIVDNKDAIIAKNIRFLNIQGYFDGNDPWSRNAYIYEFINDTLISVRRGMISLSREVNYNKYATPPK